MTNQQRDEFDLALQQVITSCAQMIRETGRDPDSFKTIRGAMDFCNSSVCCEVLKIKRAVDVMLDQYSKLEGLSRAQSAAMDAMREKLKT